MRQGIAVIAGLGKTGISVARHLSLRGWRIAGTDTRVEPPGLDALHTIQPGVQLRTGGLDPALLEGAS